MNLYLYHVLFLFCFYMRAYFRFLSTFKDIGVEEANKQLMV